MNNAILMEVESLRRASLAALREKYREVFAEEPHSRHREHLFRSIAWRLQALAEGGLSERARERARDIAQDASLRTVAPIGFFTVEGQRVRTIPGDRDRTAHDIRMPLPGTLFNRKWNGRNILVEVLADGFRYDNKHYRTLSAVAVAATGSRWNGFAFFGLTGGPRKERSRAKK